MNIVSNLNEWREIRRELSAKSIGLVHTMGNLHAGHMSLCERSLTENDLTIACIFTNPTQFNQVSDFEKYPRTLEADIALLTAAKVDYLLLPTREDIYQDDYQIQLHETQISNELEGEFRPGHFTGMLTVVAKVLNIVQPTRSYYGEKDFQQQLLIKKMVSALFMTYDIIACPTVREESGLALSSRNSRLTEDERAHARHLSRLLQSPLNVCKIADELTALGFKVEYVVEKWQRRLAAVWLADVRLIDNVAIVK